MKNIHILPTDKPSRLGQSVFNKSLHFNSIFNYELEKERVIPQHIYITSDDEIKEGDWVITPTNDIIQWAKVFQPDGKKIILTTDQVLISNGVQPIDDEFLEWFVKNPSCEKVEVKRGKMKLNDDGQEYGFPDMSLYKIIIPKEEPKQETLEEAAERLIFKTIGGNYGIMSSDENDQVDGYYNTYEEAYLTFKLKWQQERMYSEEEVTQLLIKFNQEIQEVEDVRGWFEQFKKK